MVTYKEKELKNKSRQGKYYYVSDKGKPSRYFKVKPDIPVESYLAYYQDRYKKGRKVKGTLRAYESAFLNKPLGKVKVSRSLKSFVNKFNKVISSKQDTKIKTGITSTTIENIHNFDESQVRIAYKKLLKPLVLDESLLNLLTLETNLERLKNRFEYIAYLKDEEGKVIEEISIIGKKTLRQIIQEIISNYRLGMNFHQISGTGKIMFQKDYSTTVKDSKKSLARIDMEIVFRKG